MTELAIIVEGNAEHSFVNGTLKEHLQAKGVDAWGRLPGQVRRSGGVPKWSVVRGDICRTLKERSGRYCTLLFDFYGMPHDWPGRREAASVQFGQKATTVEAAIMDDICQAMGTDFRREFFLPYVQMHEFEALLFSDVHQTANELSVVRGPVNAREQIRLHTDLQQIVNEAGSPEQINDSEATAPSKRILRLVPGYRKGLSGPIILQRIGINMVRQRCPHFDQWLMKLEELGDCG